MERINNIKTTFIAALISGVCTHGFALTNVLHNHDNIEMYLSGYGTGLSSGRWFLTLLGDYIGKVWGNYNIPFFIGLLSIFLLSLSACFIVDLFKITSKVFSGIIGALFLCYPVVTSTMFYRFTTGYYAFAILMMVFAVWSADRIRGVQGILLGSLLCALSLGIYQAYLPLAAALCVLRMLQKGLDEDIHLKEIFLLGVRYLAMLILGLILYFVVLQIMLQMNKVSLNEYQGINQMGKVNFSELLMLIKNAYSSFFKLPFEDMWDISNTKVIQKSILILEIVSGIVMIQILYRKKNWLDRCALLLLCLIFPLAVNSIIIMVPNGDIRTLMVYGTVVIYFVPIILLNYKKRVGGSACEIFEILVILVMSLVICNYCWQSNGNYTATYYATEQAVTYFNSMVTQVRMTEDYDVSMQWAFVGAKIEDPLFNNKWENSKFLYGGYVNEMLNVYSRNKFIEVYMGLDIPWASQEDIEELQYRSDVKAMSCYPNDGSIRVIDDTIVIKLEDVQ